MWEVPSAISFVITISLGVQHYQDSTTGGVRSVLSTCLMEKYCRLITNFRCNTVGQRGRRTWCICTRVSPALSPDESYSGVVGGLSWLRGNHHGQFLGERDTATCALLPDRGAVGKVPRR